MLEQCCLTYICTPRKNLVHFSRMIQHLECCSPLLFKYCVIPIASYPCSLCMQIGTAVLLKCTHICHIGLGGVRMQALSPEILGGPQLGSPHLHHPNTMGLTYDGAGRYKHQAILLFHLLTGQHKGARTSP